MHPRLRGLGPLGSVARCTGRPAAAAGAPTGSPLAHPLRAVTKARWKSTNQTRNTPTPPPTPAVPVAAASTAAESGTTASSPGQSSSSSSSSSSGRLLLSVGVVVGLAGLAAAVLTGSTSIAHAAEGDSRKTARDLDLPSDRNVEDGFTVGHTAHGYGSDAFQFNKDGEVEWMSTSTRPRIVVLGTGWGSVSFLKHLDINKYELVVISPRNYFLFTPLLPSACTGTLEMGSLTEPIRHILSSRHQTDANQYVEAKAVDLDRAARKVTCVDSNNRPFVIEYDHLLIGVGANNNTFNTPGVKDYAYFLKEAKHARVIRKEILDKFERASSPTTNLAEKEALLQFVIVGGGPTGVEFAGELVDFLDSDLMNQFPSLIPLVRVRLIQSQEHILNTYDEAISRYAEEKFRQLRIEVITGARVQAIDENTLTFQDRAKTLRTIPFSLCLWSTGIMMNEFTRTVSAGIVGQESEKALVTDEYLRLLQHIPELDRVPKRIVKEAEAKMLQPQQQQQTQAGAKSDAKRPAPSVVPAPLTPPANPPSSTPAAPAPEPAACDLSVDSRVYAFGDCATTYMPKLAKRLKRLFTAADVDGDGRLSWEELNTLCYTLSKNFPVMSAQMSLIMSQYARFVPDSSKERTIDLKMFDQMLAEADKNARAYPATAQVASQQGKYLAQRFNAFARHEVKVGHMKDEGGKDHWHLQQRLVKAGAYQRAVHPPIFSCAGEPGSNATNTPFRYRHLGNLAYIGAENAAIDLGEAGTYKGWLTFWLWKSIYLSESVSMRTRLQLMFDWTKTWFFGRDTSKP